MGIFSREYSGNWFLFPWILTHNTQLAGTRTVRQGEAARPVRLCSRRVLQGAADAAPAASERSFCLRRSFWLCRLTAGQLCGHRDRQRSCCRIERARKQTALSSLTLSFISWSSELPLRIQFSFTLFLCLHFCSSTFENLSEFIYSQSVTFSRYVNIFRPGPLSLAQKS